MFEIVIDSTCDLPFTLLDGKDIRVVDLPIIVDGVEYKKLNKSHNREAIIELLKDKNKIVKTSQPSPGSFVECFEQILKEGKDILYIGLSSKVSGCYQSSLLAIEILKESYPKRTIRAFDSYNASYGIGLLVKYALNCRNNNMSLDETYNFLLAKRPRIYSLLASEDLFYLNRSGRISRIKAVTGTMLNFIPFLKASIDGELLYFEKARGRKHAMHSMAKKCFDLSEDYKNQIIGIGYGANKEEALELKKYILDNNPPKEVEVFGINQSLLVNVGIECLAIFFEGNNDVKNY